MSGWNLGTKAIDRIAVIRGIDRHHILGMYGTLWGSTIFSLAVLHKLTTKTIQASPRQRMALA